MIDNTNRYTQMQQRAYDVQADMWSVTNRNPVVGYFDDHNEWDDYRVYLWKDIINLSEKEVLDFGCGPGRNLVKWHNLVKSIDGVDISEINLSNALIWIIENGLNPADFTLYKNDGISLSTIPSERYDVVMSTVALQHICVYEIRLNLLKEFYRVLRPGGKITIQMGFGPDHPRSVGYYDNFYDATGTNSEMDTRIVDTDQIRTDLLNIGFTNFNSYIRPIMPGDSHSNWIFFNAEK